MIPAVFPLSVPGVGDFIFRARKRRDSIWIQSNALHTFGRPAPAQPTLPAKEEDWTEEDRDAFIFFASGATLWDVAMAIASISRLAVEMPPGFSVEDADPLDREDMAAIQKVYRSLRQAEDDFRRKPAGNGEIAGAGA